MVLLQPSFLLVDDNPTPLQKIDDPFLAQHKVQLYIKREDLIHDQLSGNKWHKLKRNLQAAVDQGYSQVISFGGAYSNHIHALAFAAPLFGLQAIGVIRSDEKVMNPTLSDAAAWGMKIHYVSRQEYKKRDEHEYWQTLQAQYDNAYVIPEGGNNVLAVMGCTDIVKRIDQQGVAYDAIAVACGTGGTMAGLIAGSTSDKRIYGFSVLKGDIELENRIEQRLAEVATIKHNNWQVMHGYHQGGYAKVSDELLSFMKRFTDNTAIALEPIYTGKMLFGLYSMISEGRIAKGTTVVAVHTGGLQGLRGMSLDKSAVK
jgi:1-aminocyclopropane-1-carboxylate deaminase/D-cysteine desulfhydrase-like pyridoxal-dependent ACC family enzyme